jgi:hypothetical protein
LGVERLEHAGDFDSGPSGAKPVGQRLAIGRHVVPHAFGDPVRVPHQGGTVDRRQLDRTAGRVAEGRHVEGHLRPCGLEAKTLQRREFSTAYSLRQGEIDTR